MELDQLWEDDMYEEPPEAPKQRKSFVGRATASTHAAAQSVSSETIV